MKKVAYMCGVNYQHELDPDNPSPVRLYSTVDALKDSEKCWEECGIVKVEIELAEWVEEQTL